MEDSTAPITNFFQRLQHFPELLKPSYSSTYLTEFCKTLSWISDFSNLLGIVMLKNEASPVSVCIIHCLVQQVLSDIKWTMVLPRLHILGWLQWWLLGSVNFYPVVTRIGPIYSREKAITSNLPQKEVMNYQACVLLPLSSSLSLNHVQQLHHPLFSLLLPPSLPPPFFFRGLYHEFKTMASTLMSATVLATQAKGLVLSILGGKKRKKRVILLTVKECQKMEIHLECKDTKHSYS